MKQKTSERILRGGLARWGLLTMLAWSPLLHADLRDGLVSYWPLDEVVGTKTPDLASGYDMELANLTAADLVAGRRGQAFRFENARQTMLRRINNPGEQLPINQHPAFTITFWANVTGTGLNDLRLFSEASTTDNNPLFNLGTANTGNDGTLDFYFRQSGWTDVNHLRSVGQPLDGTWRHITFVQQADGSRALYIDGVRDAVEIPAKPPGAWRVNTTTLGGILRANPTHWLTGLLDEVALWNRALTEAEIQQVVTTGVPIPFTRPQPLTVRSFTADFPAVAAGDKVWLRWDVTKNVQVEIDQGVGDVTAQTVAGLGAIEVTIPVSRTFTLTLRRGNETATAQVSVAAIDGIANGWSLVDNFDRYTEGLLNGQGGWKDLDAVEWTVASVNGNLMAVATNNNAAAVLRLGTLAIPPGQQRTLFFRVYHANDEFAAAQGMVALTDRNMRFGSDVGAAGNDIGPGAIVSNEMGWLMAGGANGNNAAVEFYEPVLQFQTVYNVWVDIKNDPITPAPFSSGDTYSIHVTKDGEAQRTTVITDYLSARGPGAADVGFATDPLDKLVLGALANHTADARLLFFDDLYLSKSGYLSTVPRPFGFTTPLPGQPPSLSISRAGNQVTVSWSAGTLESAPAVTGPWTPVAGANSPYTTPATAAARFYRARQ